MNSPPLKNESRDNSKFPLSADDGPKGNTRHRRARFVGGSLFQGVPPMLSFCVYRRFIGNSSIPLPELLGCARSIGHLVPAIPAGGFSDAPALSIANDVMQN